MFFNGVLSLFERGGYLGIFYWSQTTFDNGKYTFIALSYYYILYDKNMPMEREIWHSRLPREKLYVFLLVSRNTFKYNDFDCLISLFRPRIYQ